jgi:hypothetical protein
MDHCPLCNERAIGKVGVDQYFCWECCVEFSVHGNNIKMFNVEADGTLTTYTSTQDIVNLQS